MFNQSNKLNNEQKVHVFCLFIITYCVSKVSCIFTRDINLLIYFLIL